MNKLICKAVSPIRITFYELLKPVTVSHNQTLISFFSVTIHKQRRQFTLNSFSVNHAVRLQKKKRGGLNAGYEGA